MRLTKGSKTSKNNSSAPIWKKKIACILNDTILFYFDFF